MTSPKLIVLKYFNIKLRKSWYCLIIIIIIIIMALLFKMTGNQIKPNM